MRKRKIPVPSYEELFKFYITDNHSIKDGCDYYNVCPGCFTEWLAFRDIYKPKTVNYPSENDLIKYYVNEIHSIDECAKYFEVSYNRILIQLRKYKLKANPKLKSIQSTNHNKERWASYSYEEKEQIKQKTSATLKK